MTKWSKLGTRWEGVSVDTLLDGIDTSAEFVTAFADGGYTTNLPLDDVQNGQAWVVYGFEGEGLEPEHGGPARLLVPHLYFWKSAKWVRGLRLSDDDEPGFWESVGYHNYGDPWREQRYWGTERRAVVVATVAETIAETARTTTLHLDVPLGRATEPGSTSMSASPPKMAIRRSAATRSRRHRSGASGVDHRPHRRRGSLAVLDHGRRRR